MAWVRIVREEEATGLLREIYGRRSPSGRPLPEVIRVFSNRPELMDLRARVQERIALGGSGLGRFREELIAVSISALTNCRF